MLRFDSLLGAFSIIKNTPFNTFYEEKEIISVNMHPGHAVAHSNTSTVMRRVGCVGGYILNFI